MDTILHLLERIQPWTEHVLDVFFHGQDPTTIAWSFAIVAMVGVVIAIIASRFRIFVVLSAIVLVAMFLLVVVTIYRGDMIRCENVVGTLTYQFFDEKPTDAEVTLRRCRSAPIGVAEYGPWSPPKIVSGIVPKLE